jgi:hypothetical protein
MTEMSEGEIYRVPNQMIIYFLLDYKLVNRMAKISALLDSTMRRNEEQTTLRSFLHQHTYCKNLFHRQHGPIHTEVSRQSGCPSSCPMGLLHAAFLQPFQIEQGHVCWSPPVQHSLARQTLLVAVK